MSRASPVPSVLRSAGFPAIALIAMAFFGYYAVFGPNGVLAWRDYNQQVVTKKAEFQTLDRDRQTLKHRVSLLKQPGGADRDMVEELLRKEYKSVREDEVVVPLSRKTP